MNELSDQDRAERGRRRRLALTTAVLLIGLPIYIIAASWLTASLTEPVVDANGVLIDSKPVHWALELLIYIVLGALWAFPLKRLVTGLGKKSG